MSETSRRKFIAAAGVSAAAGTGALVASAPGARAARPSGRGATESVLVVVQPDTDAVQLLVGEREVVVRDRDLATRIRNAAGGN